MDTMSMYHSMIVPPNDCNNYHNLVLGDHQSYQKYDIAILKTTVEYLTRGYLKPRLILLICQRLWGYTCCVCSRAHSGLSQKAWQAPRRTNSRKDLSLREVGRGDEPARKSLTLGGLARLGRFKTMRGASDQWRPWETPCGLGWASYPNRREEYSSRIRQVLWT